MVEAAHNSTDVDSDDIERLGAEFLATRDSMIRAELLLRLEPRIRNLVHSRARGSRDNRVDMISESVVEIGSYLEEATPPIIPWVEEHVKRLVWRWEKQRTRERARFTSYSTITMGEHDDDHDRPDLLLEGMEAANRRKVERDNAPPRPRPGAEDRYTVPLHPRLDMAIDMDIAVSYRRTLATKKERVKVAAKSRDAVKAFLEAVNRLPETAHDVLPEAVARLHAVLSDEGTFPKEMGDLLRIVCPQLVWRNPRPGLWERTPPPAPPDDFPAGLTLGVEEEITESADALERLERMLPSSAEWATWARLALESLDRLAALDDPCIAGVPVTGNKANPYRDRVIHEARRWQDERGPQPTGARLAHAYEDRIHGLDVAGHFNLEDDDPRVVARVLGFGFNEEDPLEGLRSSLGGRLATLRRKILFPC